MASIEEKVESLVHNVINSLGYELYDVIYEKEAQDYYLRIFIDKPEGISLDDCEKVNDAITDLLDDANYIKEQYFLEVSSPGVERLLRKEKHFENSIGKEVTVSLFKPLKLINEEEKDNSLNKKQKKQKEKPRKQIDGILSKFDENFIYIISENKELELPKKDISNVKLKFNW